MMIIDLDMNAARARRTRPARPRQSGTGLHPQATDLCIVVPMHDQHDAICDMIERIGGALGATRWEMIIVDDRFPGRAARVDCLVGKHDPHVRLMRRVGRPGTASACLDGLLASDAPLLAVMDADPRHDPLMLPAMTAMLRAGGADLVVAGRSHVSAVEAPEPGERARRFAIAAIRRVGAVTLQDPLSGYFAFTRDAFDRVAPRLAGIGPGLLPDMLLAAPELRVREIPVNSDPWLDDEGRFSPRGVWDYATVLARHRVGDPSARLLAYLPIAAVVLAIHAGAFWLFHDLYGLGLGAAQLVAAAALCAATYALREWLSCRGSDSWRWYLGLLPFLVTRAVGLIAASLITSWLVGKGLNVWASASAGAVALAWWNYDAVHRYGGFAR